MSANLLFPARQVLPIQWIIHIKSMQERLHDGIHHFMLFHLSSQVFTALALYSSPYFSQSWPFGVTLNSALWNSNSGKFSTHLNSQRFPRLAFGSYIPFFKGIRRWELITDVYEFRYFVCKMLVWQEHSRPMCMLMNSSIAETTYKVRD